MPWLGDDFGMKDPTQAMPGLSLVQWMNMQQNPSLSNSMQQNYMSSLPSSVLQNLAGPDMSRQLGLPSAQIPQQNTLQFNNTQRPNQSVQQLDQLQKLPSSTLNTLGSIMQQPQQQFTDVNQHRQNLISQSLPTSQVQSQILPSQNSVQTQNGLQQQQSFLNHQHLQRALAQNIHPSNSEQQNVMPSQSSNHGNQQLHVQENQIQMQLLQKLHQQQQSLLAQQSAIQQQPQQQLQDHQKQLLEIQPNFSRSMSTSQMLDASQAMSSMMPQSHGSAQQMKRNNSQANLRFAQPKLQQSGMLSEMAGNLGHNLNPTNSHLSGGGGSLLNGAAGGVQSAVTDDVPSCSTSPSTNNCPSGVQSIMNSRNNRNAMMGDEIAQSSASLLNPNGLETMPSSGSNLIKELQQKADVKPSLNVSKSQNPGFFASQNYMNATGTQMDYLDSSSSATSVLSQNEIHIPPSNNSISFNSQSMLFRDAIHDVEVQGDPRSSVPFGANNIDSQLGMPMMADTLITKNMVGPDKDFQTNNLSSGGGMLSSYENPKEAQPELSSSMVSQSFGVPDMTFNSIDSTINDGSFMNRGAWAPPQIPRLRTYTKVGCLCTV